MAQQYYIGNLTDLKNRGHKICIYKVFAKVTYLTIFYINLDHDARQNSFTYFIHLQSRQINSASLKSYYLMFYLNNNYSMVSVIITCKILIIIINLINNDSFLSRIILINFL